MPTTVQVKVNTIGSTTRGNSNMVEMTGYDHTNNRGFKKLFFEEKKSGGRTRNAEVADTLSKDDWVEVTMDDTSYKNVQSIKKIAEPAGGESTPSQSSYKKPAGGGGKKKGEFRTVPMLNREVALKSAVSLMGPVKLTKTIIDSLEKLAYRLEAFLVKGDFDAELDTDPVVEEKPVAQTDNTPAAGNDPAPAPVDDDDIPF